jgi:hypothetical protein
MRTKTENLPSSRPSLFLIIHYIYLQSLRKSEGNGIRLEDHAISAFVGNRVSPPPFRKLKIPLYLFFLSAVFLSRYGS